MSILFHPSKDNPTCLRVYDKRNGVQKYFSFKEHGVRKATQLAKELQAELDKKNKTNALIGELSINRIFNDDGSVKGLLRRKRSRDGRADAEHLVFQARVKVGVTKHFEVSLNNRKFDDAYKIMKEKIYAGYGVEKTLETEKLFRAARKLYW